MNTERADAMTDEEIVERFGIMMTAEQIAWTRAKGEV